MSFHTALCTPSAFLQLDTKRLAAYFLTYSPSCLQALHKHCRDVIQLIQWQICTCTIDMVSNLVTDYFLISTVILSAAILILV